MVCRFVPGHTTHSPRCHRHCCPLLSQFGEGVARATATADREPTELASTAQPDSHRPTGACNTTRGRRHDRVHEGAGTHRTNAPLPTHIARMGGRSLRMRRCPRSSIAQGGLLRSGHAQTKPTQLLRELQQQRPATARETPPGSEEQRHQDQERYDVLWEPRGARLLSGS